MCRFKLVPPIKLFWLIEFQYILCVGSSVEYRENEADDLSFNTSYVSVQDKSAISICLANYVSIHPMCRFKLSAEAIAAITARFQYILCVGSR